MKRLRSIVLAAALALTVGCGGHIIEIKVHNPTEQPLTNAIVTIDYKALQKKFPGIRISPEFSLADETGHVLPTQFDDINGDQKWDEISVLTDFLPGQTRIFRFKQTPDSLKSTDQTARLWLKLGDTTVRPMIVDEVYGKSPESEKRYAGITWQNGGNFFRIRFHPSNAIDLLPLPDSIRSALANSDSVVSNITIPWPAAPQTPNLGGFVLSENGQIFPAHRLFGYQARVISRGPVRTVLRLDYEDWPTNTVVTKVAWLLMSYHRMPVVEHRFFLKPTPATKVPAVAVEKPLTADNFKYTGNPAVYPINDARTRFFTIVAHPDYLLENSNAPQFIFLQPNLQTIPALRYFTVATNDTARLGSLASEMRNNLSHPLVVEF